MATDRSPVPRRARSLLLAGLLLLAVPSGAGAAINTCSGSGATFAGGSGTSASPYLVATAAQLAAIRTSTYRTCAFRQTADIALSGEWTPIGEATNAATYFTGDYDGDGHRISGLSITTGGAYLGLFGVSGSGAVLRNMRLSGSVDAPGSSNVGALVGLADRPTTITNVHSSVSVSADQVVGGLVGWLAESVIRRSSSTGAVTAAKGTVGGLVGNARSSTDGLSSEITDSYATGAVTGATGYAGVAGLVGSPSVGAGAPYFLLIARSYATGAVTGGTGSRETCMMGCITFYGTTGGILAQQTLGTPVPNLTVESSFWDTQTTGRATTADDKGTGATTAQMRSYATFSAAGWDIANGWSASAVWGICDGSTYPFLTTEYGSSPCSAPASTTPAAAPTPTSTAKPDVTIEVSTPIDGAARVTVRWSARAGTAATTLTTTLPPGVAFQRTGSGCATAKGRLVSIAVPALQAGGRGSCSFPVAVTRRTVSLTLVGGATRAVSRTVRSTASAAAWVREALAVIERGTPRATLNRALEAVRAGRMSRAGAAALIRSDVLGVREAQIAALARMDRAPAALARAERLLRRSLVLSADADRAYIASLGGEPRALDRAIAISIHATRAKTRLIGAMQGHGVAVPPASVLWP